jgi:hypothetical protein
MKLLPLVLAVAVCGASAATASAATYDITIASGDGTITGVMTVNGSDVVTSFVGTASGFFGGAAIFNGPVTLGQGAGGPTFTIDDKFTTTPDYFSTGGNGYGGGLGLLTTAGYNFRIYDYTDIFNNYGVRTAWFGDSGGSPSTVTFTAVPEPATWALMALGFAGLGATAYRSRRRQAFAPA